MWKQLRLVGPIGWGLAALICVATFLAYTEHEGAKKSDTTSLDQLSATSVPSDPVPLASPPPATDPIEHIQTQDLQVALVDGEQPKTIQLLPQKIGADIAPMANFIRDAGFSCDSANSIRQLQENGDALEIFKIDCIDGGSFQATILNEKTYIKPWTGKLLGR